MTTERGGVLPEERVARVAEVVRRNAATAEAERRLTPETVTALLDAGLFQVWTPRAYGGLELDAATGLRLFEELSRLDSAAGWVAGIGAVGAVLCAALPEAGAAEVLADPRAVLAGAFNPPGRAAPVEGGYRVDGQWPFASGCDYATWFSGLCMVMDGDAPRFGPDGAPVLLAIFYPRAEAEVVDTWHSLGMRGTGSHDVRVAGAFVPERRSFVLGAAAEPGGAFAGPLYRLGAWLIGAQVAATALGVARAALEQALDLAARKTPSFMQVGLADKPVVQERLARAQALIQAGRSGLDTAVTEATALVTRGERLQGAAGVALGLAEVFAVEAATEAVDLIHTIAGTSAIRTEQPFQQYFRDVHTISQHAFGSPNRYESLGKLMLGVPSDWAFYNG